MAQSQYLVVIGRHGGWRNLCHSFRFLFQQRVPNMFPGSGISAPRMGYIYISIFYIHISMNLYLYLSITHNYYLSLYLSIYLLINQSINQSTNQSICLSACLSVYLSVCYLFISFFFLSLCLSIFYLLVCIYKCR